MYVRSRKESKPFWIVIRERLRGKKRKGVEVYSIKEKEVLKTLLNKQKKEIMYNEKKLSEKVETKVKAYPPSHHMFQSWSFETKCWWANLESGNRKPKANAPCTIFYGEPYNYAIVWYRHPETNFITEIESMSLSEASHVITRYELALMANAELEN